MTGPQSPRPAPRPLGTGQRFARCVYNLVLAALLPLLALWLAWRVTLGGKTRRGFMQRLGVVPPEARADAHRGTGRAIWVHAVSVGEVSVAGAIIREMLARDDSLRILLSVTTATGHQVASAKLTECEALFYLPIDVPLCVNAALEAMRPDMLVVVETELWPNLLDAAHRRGVRTVVCNGRVSDRSFRRSRHARWLYRWALHCVDHVFAQSPQDAERFIALGAREGSVTVTGSCKFDEEFPVVTPEAADAMRRKYGLAPESLVWLTGSTGPGEDEPLIDAHAEARRRWPALRMIHAPRHPERADEVAEIIKGRGLGVIRRTEMRAGLQPEMGHDSVILLDTIGELTRLYSICDVAFVGRSLVPLGGGNVLQPLHYGKPVIVGRHTSNFRDTVGIAERAGVLFEAPDGPGVARELVRLLGDEELRASIVTRAKAVFDEHCGASGRTAVGILRCLSGG